MTSERDAHPDEGTIHAWLDRQLDATSASTLEAHLQRCDECAERVAEARGLIAGASRVIASLDDPTMSSDAAPRRPVIVATSGAPALRRFRLTPARSAIAAVLVVAVGLAIVNEHERPSSKLARASSESAMQPQSSSSLPPMASAPTVATPPASPLAAHIDSPSAVASGSAPALTTFDSTASTRVAAARAFARAQRETTVNADLARVGQVPPAQASTPAAQTIAAAKVADSVAGDSRGVLTGAVGGVPAVANRGVAGGVSRAASAPAPAAPAPAVAGFEAPQCYRVESANGSAATWGPVALPIVLALDAPATRPSVRVLTADGKDTDARATFERRGNDSLLFSLRRIGYTGSLVVGTTGDVRAGVMRSAPSTLALSEVVVTTPTVTPQRRALRKPSAAASRADSAAPPERAAAPAVPVVVKKVGC